MALVTTVLSVVAATTPTASSAAAPGTPADRPAITLKRDRGGPGSAASVPLSAPKTSRMLASAATSPVLTRRLTTTTYKMVAATWYGADPGVTVRTRTSGGQWSAWQPLEALPGQAASELVWVGSANGVQLRTQRKAPGLDLVLIDPGATASDSTARPTVGGRPSTNTGSRLRSTAKAVDRSAPRPTLYDRRAWKADPSWLNGKPVYTTRPKQVHLHHTASANGYSRADVPAMLRGMYRYHTKTLGWFDIGYNFLVDRFGRAWIGRSGGARRMVKGAHTLGFNNNSVGIALIGNYQSRYPSAAARTKVVQLAAWKFDLHDQTGVTKKILMVSAGSDRFPRGKRVWLPRIDGHRDTNETACPGAKAYSLLPNMRSRVQATIDRYN